MYAFLDSCTNWWNYIDW